MAAPRLRGATSFIALGSGLSLIINDSAATHEAMRIAVRADPGSRSTKRAAREAVRTGDKIFRAMSDIESRARLGRAAFDNIMRESES